MMFFNRLLAIPLSLVVLPLTCLGDEKEKGPSSSVKSARSEIQPYVDWLPANSQTLVVSQRLFQIPAERPEDAALDTVSLDAVYLRMHVMHMFEGEAREVLAGKRIRLWIEAASRFYFPEFPDEVEDAVETVGVSTHYDGCHVLVLDEAAAPDTPELFEKLLLQHPEPTSQIPAAKRHVIDGYNAIAYSVSPPDLNHSRTTPEQKKRIDATLSIRYWIASPVENVLVVATSREVLEETLRKVSNPDQKAFPASLEGWMHITGDMPTWGMRHLPEKPDPFDHTPLTSLRDEEEGYDVSGLTFGIDGEADKAELTFVNCSSKMLVRIQSMIRREFTSLTSTTVGPHHRVLFYLDWSEETPDDARKAGRQFVFWLLYHLGHAAVI
jgi:hypothetical protein